MKQRSKRLGGAAVTVLLAAVLIFLNCIFALSADNGLGRADLSQGRQFTLSQQTLDYLKEDLHQSVVIYVMDDRQTYRDSGNYFYQADALLQEYARQSSLVSVQYLDLSETPDLAALFPDLSLSVGDIVVQAGGEYRHLPATLYFNTYTVGYGGQQMVLSSRVEEMVTTAILDLVSEETVTAAFAGDESLYGPLYDLMDQNGYQVSEVQLDALSGDYSCRILILAAGEEDFSAAEMENLAEFLYNDGSYGRQVILLDGPHSAETPNLDAFLNQWGVYPQAGIVTERNSMMMVNENPYYIVADSADSALAASTAARSEPVVFPLARPVTVKSAEGLTVETMYAFTADSYLSTGAEDTGADAQDGPFPALVASSTQGENPSRLIYCTSSVAASQSILDSGSFANRYLFLELGQRLTDKQDYVDLLPRVFEINPIGIGYVPTVVLGAVLTAVVPLAILGFGLIVWMGRRRL